MYAVTPIVVPDQTRYYTFWVAFQNFVSVSQVTADIALIQVPNDSIITGIRIKNVQQWVGTDITSLTAFIGASRASDQYDAYFYGGTPLSQDLTLSVNSRSQVCLSPFASYSAGEHFIFARFEGNRLQNQSVDPAGPPLRNLTQGKLQITVGILSLGYGR